MPNNKNKVETLIAMKESIDKVFDEKIKKARIDEAVNSLGEKSFTTLNDIFRDVSMNLSESKEGEKLIKDYARTIMCNEGLKELYTLYNITRKANGVSEPSVFASYIAEKVGNIDKKVLKEGLSSLSNIVKECVGVSGLDLSELDEIINRSENDFNMAFTFLSENKCTTKNAVEWSNNFSKVVEFVNENCTENINVNNSDVNEERTRPEMISLIENIVNDRIDSDWSNRVKSDIVMSELSGKDNKTLFESYKNECLAKIEELLENASIDEKSRLDGMKKNILLKEYSEEGLVNDLLNMGELSEVLSSNKN